MLSAMVIFQLVCILCILMCLVAESIGSNEGMFFNSWPYNTGKKATKEKSDDGKDAPNSWLFGSDSSQENFQAQQASAPAPASYTNTGGFQSQTNGNGGGQGTNFQMKTVNNNQWGGGQNSEGFNNNHRQQQQGAGYNKQHGQQFHSGNRNTQQNQRGGGGSQFGFGNSNNNYNYNNFQGNGFQATTSTTTTTTTTTTTPQPAKANQYDGMFFNSWPYNTNSNKKKTQDDWKAKNEPNPFLIEVPKEYPPQRKAESNSNSQSNFGFNNRNRLANDFKTPQTQEQSAPHNSFQHPYVWPEVSKTTPSSTTTTMTREKAFNIQKNKWQYEKEAAEEERRRQKENTVSSDDNVNQWNPPSKKLDPELESYLQNLANSMREKMEKSELEKVDSNMNEGKLDKGNRNFRFPEPEDLNSVPKQSALISENDGTMFQDPPTSIQEDKYWYLPKSMREFVGIESKSHSSQLQTSNCILYVCLVIAVACTK